jgi:M6 family metalloprotease-like protein
MKTRFLPRPAPAWRHLLSLLCLSGALSASASTLTNFGYANMATGPSRPMLVILANFASPSFPGGANITTYSNRVFEVSTTKWTANSYFKEVSNNRFQWEPAAVLRVDMPESGRWANFGNDSAYASNIIYCAVATNAFNWDVYGQPGSTNLFARDLAITLFSNDGGKSARPVSNIRPPGRTKTYSGLVYVGNPSDSLDIDCHEMAHILGAIDFYGLWGVGECLAENLSLMSCSDGSRKHLDAWHKLQFGWSEPRIFPLNSNGTTTLNAAQLGLAYAPIILYDTNRGPGEFFLLEYRTKTVTNFGGGYDAGVYGNGLVIWHVAHEANKKPPLMAELAWPQAERLWRECTKCRALTYGTASPGPCVAGTNGVHEPFKDDHGLIKNDPNASGQPGWKLCTKCKCLFFGPNQTASKCQAGGTHLAGTDNFTLITDTTVLANPKWHRCTKCETLVRDWYNAHAPWTANSACVAGGRHAPDTSVMYMLPSFWGINALQPEAYPDLRRAESDVWPGGSSTPWLHWYDQTPACVTVQVQPFVTGDTHIRIDWLNEAGTWVDFSYSGTKNGSFSQPFNLLSEGVNAVSPGGYLHIKFSYSPLPANITKPMRIRAYGGPALIGRNP